MTRKKKTKQKNPSKSLPLQSNTEPEKKQNMPTVIENENHLTPPPNAPFQETHIGVAHYEKKSIDELSAEVTQLQQRVHEQGAALRRIRNSRSFRWSRPFHKLNNWWMQRIRHQTPVDLIPYFHVSATRLAGEDVWLSLGDDPQLLIQPTHQAITSQPGWFMLDYFFECKHPTSQQVFFDLGEGFVPTLNLTWEAQQSGHVSIPLYLPSDLRTLRLDPMTHEGHFKIKNGSLRRLSHAPNSLLPQNKATYAYLEHHKTHRKVLGLLSPVQQLISTHNNPLHWRSVGEDPYFTWTLPNLSNLSASWYLWNIELEREDAASKPCMSRLYLDTGKGYNELETVNLPLTDTHDTARVFFSNKPIERIRFDPIDHSGGFKLKALNIQPITEADALDSMLTHVSDKHPNYIDKTHDEVVTSVALLSDSTHKTCAEILLKLYEETQTNNNRLIDYQTWMETIEPIGLPAVEIMRQNINAFTYKPLISIIMPTYNTPDKYLRLCIESVIKQNYPYWELCIADDNSPQKHVQRTLKEYAQRDPRIKYTIREVNGHISAASNSALTLATGDFVALLDHDDELPPYALYFIAEAINTHPDAAVIYSDEDKIDESGSRFEPHFKSDWNPDLFFSQNYVSHLGVYRRTLLEQISGFRLGVEGSQDQDLLLRCLPHIDSTQIIHVPRVLYHWRTLPGSTAMAAGEKTYTTDAGIKALEDYFQQIGQQVRVEMGKVPNTYRVHYPVPTPEPLVSLLIPTRDKVELIETAVRSILEKSTYQNYEILILDNGSIEEATLKYFAAIQAQDSRVRVLRWDFPFNYSAINNFGASQAKGEILGLINNDIEVISPEWLSEMVSHAIRPEIGCVGAKLYFSNDTIQHAGVICSLGGVAGHSHKYFPRDHPGYFYRLVLPQNITAVTAAVLLVKADIFHSVSGLDETNLTVAFNDVDFCLKVRKAGYRNLWTPYAELYHYESISRGAEDNPEKLKRFDSEMDYMKKKWPSFMDQDPMYNPNLTRDREDFSITSYISTVFLDKKK